MNSAARKSEGKSMYEYMKQFVVLVAFGSIIGAGVATILESLTHLGCWIVKKVKEKKNAKQTA